MCQAFFYDARFYQALFQLDQAIASDLQMAGCSHCGGPLHVAHYPRKPRGIRSVLDDTYQSRLSFCCARDGCRRRHTPPSVRFLGRKVYLSVVVVLITALHHGLTKSRRRQLLDQLDIPAQTLWRWQRWWREQFVQNRCWRGVAEQFIPPITCDHLPGSLLGRLTGGGLAERLVQLLILISPLT